MQHMLLVCSCFHSLQTCSFCILINYVTAGNHQQVSRILHVSGSRREMMRMRMVVCKDHVHGFNWNQCDHTEESHILYNCYQQLWNQHISTGLTNEDSQEIHLSDVRGLSEVLAKRFFLTIVAPGRMLVSGTWLISRTFHIIFLWLTDCCQNPTC